MSKYTKALEKIQQIREAREGAGRVVTAARVPAAESVPAAEPAWDRGIRTVKNTSPEDHIVMLRHPDCMTSEQYRMLRTSLKAELVKTGAKVIMISSSIHAEGKTVTTANLAVSLAENGDARVAVIDADLRRGRLAEYLGFGKDRPGLTDYLTSEMRPKEVLVRNSLANLVVMPRGAASKKASELVNSGKLQTLINELRADYDYIIIDSPPIMSVADAAILSRIVDGVVFVIQVGRTPKTVIAHAHELFHQSGARILGTVLTNVEYQSADYKYYNYYTDYQEQHPDKGRGPKKRSRHHLKRAGIGLESLENRFNQWWEKRVLKKG